MTAIHLPLAEITEKAIRTLCKEIGVVDTIRFLNQYSNGQGNYTEERRGRFAGITAEDMYREMVKDRSKTEAGK